MVNHYAPWRYILLILIIAIGVVYAAPNLYGEDPALQITHRVNLVDEAELDNIKSVLQSENIEYRSKNHECGSERRRQLCQTSGE